MKSVIGDYMSTSNNSVKYYNKALKYFQNGYIDKSINLCEKSIAESIKNKHSLNLKAMLYYFQGDIEKAKSLWKLNCEVNDDKTSKKYLNDLQEDQERFKLYMEAVPMVNVLDVNKALKLLKKCSESDFNVINVYNNIALCYISKGQFEAASECINKVLKIDKKNSEAHENLRRIKKYKYMNAGFNPKYLAALIIGVCIILAIVLCYKTLSKRYNYSILKKQKSTISSQKTTSKKQNKNQIKFPYSQIYNDIQNKQYKNIFNAVSKWQAISLQTKDKELIEKCRNILQNEGKEYFYDEGIKLFQNNDYKNAIDYFTMAQVYETDKLKLNEIIYKQAISYEITKDSRDALKSYQKYDVQYSSGIYEEPVLYKLCILTSSQDKSSSKAYAKKLVANFPQSIYIDSHIKSLVNSD